MKCNVGGADRWFRLIVGAVLLLLAFFSLTGTAQIVAGVIGALLLITGILKVCPAYYLFHFSTGECRDEAQSR